MIQCISEQTLETDDKRFCIPSNKTIQFDGLVSHHWIFVLVVDVSKYRKKQNETEYKKS